MFVASFVATCLIGAVFGALDKLPVNINYRPPQQPKPQFSQPQFIPQPQPSYRPQPEPHVVPPKYEFTYAVKDDYSQNDFGHTESRDGYNTKGSYYVLLPDGRKQIVTYYVNGDSGFVADVRYEGVARFPEPQQYRPQPQPSYQPLPQPQYP